MDIHVLKEILQSLQTPAAQQADEGVEQSEIIWISLEAILHIEGLNVGDPGMMLEDGRDRLLQTSFKGMDIDDASSCGHQQGEKSPSVFGKGDS